MKIRNIILLVFAVSFCAVAPVYAYFFGGSAPRQNQIAWGVDFSQMQAESLGLNWKQAYSAMISDLGAKNIKLHTQWDWVEGEKDVFYFSDIDWQIKRAEQDGAKIIYVLGMKTGRWPECHIPKWAKNMSKEEQQKEILDYISKVVTRYKGSSAIINWQIENEPLFNFGECPWYDKDFLKREAQLVKQLDSSRKIIISDSGEQSSWFEAAKIADIVGVTMYRQVWLHITDNIGFNIEYIFAPVTYYRKSLIIEKVFGKKVICVELQAEPWADEPYQNLSVSEQEKTMNLELFKQNVEFAKQTGLDTFYFWGAEWWYWMKTEKNHPEIWNEAKQLF